MTTTSTKTAAPPPTVRTGLAAPGSAPPSPVPAEAPFIGAVRDALIAARIRPCSRLLGGFSLGTLNWAVPVRVIVTWHPASLALRADDRRDEALRRCQAALSAAQFTTYLLNDADGPHLAVLPQAAAKPARS